MGMKGFGADVGIGLPAGGIELKSVGISGGGTGGGALGEAIGAADRSVGGGTDAAKSVGN